ncbi:rod shape-determining protein RodA [Capnocytophaga sp.]|uniref:rod shape-determining protein RodA n=1 Tax=Capnocytophaga sp. TaxID=44737 RepID=UPI0026DA78B6|nr:rod shape-determining protein RodA [Capnocytophaga sp.]MDO5105396.1 rod shape-determining protein RodA [Capnocytophaga sp.]
MKQSLVKQLDWLSILCYLLLVSIGWVAIFSTTYNDATANSIFDINQFYGKQFLFIGLSFILIIFILAIDSKFYENFSAVFYIISLVVLAGLFIFGKETNGAKSWYAIGSVTIQPSEFAKVATALFFSKFLSDIHTDIKQFKDFFKSLVILILPAFLILLQPDVGSLLVFFALIFVLFREGMPSSILFYLTLAALIFISTLKFGSVFTILISGLTIWLYSSWYRKRTNRIPVKNILLLATVCLITSLSTKIVFDNVLKQHHRNRLSLWLRLEQDPHKISEMRRDFGYNTYMSESAITSGGVFGKGFLEGTRTKGSFVPEQHTDYIFTTLGEEWGLVGTLTVVALFTFLLLRLIILAERQRSDFGRIYGYCVVSILFAHFCVNIGMVIGLIPTIGIPLPFFSYGGSGLWAFTILLFVFLRLDASR